MSEAERSVRCASFRAHSARYSGMDTDRTVVERMPHAQAIGTPMAWACIQARWAYRTVAGSVA
jgi:hypothetical protein